MRFCLVSISSRISMKGFSRCGGKDNIKLKVSITHSRRIWQVNYVQSPEIIFFSDKTSVWLADFPESQGRNTLSREWNKVCCTWRH